jgi:hypothetical protein
VIRKKYITPYYATQLPLDMQKKGDFHKKCPASTARPVFIRDRFLISGPAACHVGLLFLTSEHTTCIQFCFNFTHILPSKSTSAYPFVWSHISCIAPSDFPMDSWQNLLWRVRHWRLFHLLTTHFYITSAVKITGAKFSCYKNTAARNARLCKAVY